MGQLGHVSLQSGDKELIPRRVAGLDGVSMKEVACGGVHTCALSVEGALYAWGGGQAGQLGLGPQSGFLFCVSNGSEMLLRNVPVLIIPTDVRLVACGHSHTLVYMRDGRICGWGYNSYGQAANEKSSYAWYPSPVDWYIAQTSFVFFTYSIAKTKRRNVTAVFVQVCRTSEEASSRRWSLSCFNRCILVEGAV